MESVIAFEYPMFPKKKKDDLKNYFCEGYNFIKIP